MFKILLTIALLLFLFLSYKHINLHILLNGILLVLLYVILFFLSIFLFFINFFISKGDAFIVVLICSIILFIITCFLVYFTKINIILFITAFNNYFYKQKIINEGIIEEGNIVSINKFYYARIAYAYYLIVNINGKNITSICFRNNTYKIGDKIKVGTKGKKSIVLI